MYRYHLFNRLQMSEVSQDNLFQRTNRNNQEQTYKKRMITFLVNLFGFKGNPKETIIRKMIHKELSKDQLEQLKIGIKKGLTEKQIGELINNQLEPNQMAEIIEIALLENNM